MNMKDSHYRKCNVKTAVIKKVQVWFNYENVDKNKKYTVDCMHVIVVVVNQ